MEQGIEDETGLAAFMAEVSLATDADKNEKDASDAECVTLMTIHAAKGLEFNNVFVVGVEKDLLPSMMSMSMLSEIEEERRLLYVAITRARHFCMLSYASSRYRNGMTTVTGPSPFLRDFDRRYLRLMTGTNIDNARPINISPTPKSPSATGYKPKPAVSKPLSTPPSQPNRVAANPDIAMSRHTVNELSTGQRIVHPRFGAGVITLVDTENPMGHRIEVDFDTEGHKILLLAYAQFAIVK